jgi:plasmid stability protein
MKQMITRLDDDLHARLKAQAAVEERSMNDLVVEALIGKLDAATTRRAVRERARSTGRLVVPEPADEASDRDEVIASTRGLGDAVSTALAEERSTL